MRIANLFEYLLHRDILIPIGREVEFLCDIKAEKGFWNFGYGKDLDVSAGSKGKVVETSKKGSLISIEYYSQILQRESTQTVPRKWFLPKEGILRLI